MSAPYVAACLIAGLIVVGVFCILWKMGKLHNLKVTAQIAKIFSLSIEATSDSTAPLAVDGSSPHDPRRDDVAAGDRRGRAAAPAFRRPRISPRALGQRALPRGPPGVVCCITVIMQHFTASLPTPARCR